MKNNYAVITGASSGIGREFAKRLAKEGYPLILIARRKERLLKLASRLPVKCEILSADLTKQEECQRVYDWLKDKKIEIFINNAGFGDCGEFSRTNLEKELEMLDLNVRAAHFFMKKLVQKMLRENSGFILNVASSAGLIPAGPFMAAYYASKAYLTSLTRGVAEELRQQGSRVYVGCLCPGPVDTEFNRVANVEFALPGISAGYCAAYALKQMKKRQVVIVPTLKMKAAIFVIRVLPSGLYIRLVAHQQKRKMQ